MTDTQKSKKLKITFCSGANTVTGSNFLVEAEGIKFLIDCGLLQGDKKLADETNWAPFPYDPKTIDILFITHAHIDHIGRIPKLIADGFQGKIYSTIPTKDLTHPMLEDTANILSKDIIHGLNLIYSKENIEKALSLWQGFEYYKAINIEGGFTVRFLNAGHILGSAMIEITYNGKKIIFTGDLGNSPSPILPDTDIITDADYLIMESTYGDRNHQSHEERRNMLERAIEDNVKRKGILMIPTFSLERTQELLFEINEMVENDQIPLVPFFLDSPLAIRLTDIYQKYTDYFNEKVKAIIATGDNIFVFKGLKETLETEKSKMILKTPNPKIIIAGSGMSSGGRITHHEINYLPDPNNSLLLTGYQTPGTLGRSIQDGDKIVHIGGQEIIVRAKVSTIEGYSGHKDSDNLLKFVENTSETLKKVFVVMGEPRSSMFLVQKIRDYLAIDAIAPETGQSVEIEF